MRFKTENHLTKSCNQYTLKPLTKYITVCFGYKFATRVMFCNTVITKKLLYSGLSCVVKNAFKLWNNCISIYPCGFLHVGLAGLFGRTSCHSPPRSRRRAGRCSARQGELLGGSSLSTPGRSRQCDSCASQLDASETRCSWDKYTDHP